MEVSEIRGTFPGSYCKGIPLFHALAAEAESACNKWWAQGMKGISEGIVRVQKIEFVLAAARPIFVDKQSQTKPPRNNVMRPQGLLRHNPRALLPESLLS